MVITFILSSLRLSGGVRDIVEIANRLANDHRKIVFVVPGKTVDADIQKELSPTIEIRETAHSGAGKLSLINLARLSIELARLVPKSDIIISTQSPTTVSTFIASILLRQGTPVWFYQDYVEMFLDRPVIFWLAKNALRWHKSAIVLSKHSKEELKSRVRGKRVVVCRVGLSHVEFLHPLTADERNENKDQAKSILFLGDMRPRKGWYDFWEAMDYVYKAKPDAKVWFVSKDRCEIPSSIPCVFIYRPDRKEIARLMASCDVFVSASWWESFGIPPLEAMACGAPVAMTDSRGGREYAKHMVNCLMVPAQDPVELAKAIIRILEEPELEATLRKNGPITAAEFSWERSFAIFLEEINRVRKESS
ncbi:MAG: glycosyltransferase family 4 protein [Anaerolineaceae bacterium]|nr:glycosyltransferase family 4 protein [Anaerolineaceae bacterium]